MKKGIVLGIMSGILLLTGAGIAGAGSTWSPLIDYREWKQDQRISQGVASGSLTPWETSQLDREQARIAWLRFVGSCDL